MPYTREMGWALDEICGEDSPQTEKHRRVDFCIRLGRCEESKGKNVEKMEYGGGDSLNEVRTGGGRTCGAVDGRGNGER